MFFAFSFGASQGRGKKVGSVLQPSPATVLLIVVVGESLTAPLAQYCDFFGHAWCNCCVRARTAWFVTACCPGIESRLSAANDPSTQQYEARQQNKRKGALGIRNRALEWLCYTSQHGLFVFFFVIRVCAFLSVSVCHRCPLPAICSRKI